MTTLRRLSALALAVLPFAASPLFAQTVVAPELGPLAFPGAFQPLPVVSAAPLSAFSMAPLPDLRSPLAGSLAPLSAMRPLPLSRLPEAGSEETLSASLRSAFDGQSLRGPSGGAGLNANESGPAPLSQLEAFAAEAQRLYGNPAVIQRKPARPLGLPTDGELSGRVKLSPRERAAREQAVQDLFVLGGARREDIQLQDIGRGAHNVIVVKPGKTGKVIVVGAHSDKVDVGDGVIDNWTGSTMVTNLYQSLRDVETEHTIVFVVFGREEEGLVGSTRYVKGLDKAQLANIDAMINLDTLGVDGTFSWQNNSDPGLLKAYRDTAAKTGHDLTERVLFGGDADSSSFRRKNVPAMTLFGASPEVIFDIIHSENDNFGAFNLQHYKNSFLLTKAVIESLDKTPGRPSAGTSTLAGRGGADPRRTLPKLRPWWTEIALGRP